MRFLFALLFIFTLPFLSATNAEARGFGVVAGSSQNLEYIEDTTIPVEEFGRLSGVISVCRVSKSYHLFFLSIWKEAGHSGLILLKNSC